MAEAREPDRVRTEEALFWGGTGLCPEAQADGVPCPILGQDCETCGRGRKRWDEATWNQGLGYA